MPLKLDWFDDVVRQLWKHGHARNSLINVLAGRVEANFGHVNWLIKHKPLTADSRLKENSGLSGGLTSFRPAPNAITVRRPRKLCILVSPQDGAVPATETRFYDTA